MGVISVNMHSQFTKNSYPHPSLDLLINLGGGSFMSASIAYIASPNSPPYVGKQLTALFYTQSLLKYLVYSIAAPMHILVNKAQPSTPSIWPLSPTRLGIWPQDLGLPNEYRIAGYFGGH